VTDRTAAEQGPGGSVTDVIPGRGQYTEDARLRRLDWLRERTGAPLPALSATGLDARTLTGNLENFAGSVEVPVGLAGPLLFTGEAARGEVVAPLATTEGALVASVSRGARAITASGGVTATVLSQRMSRAPAFEFPDIATALRFTTWLQARRAQLDEQVRLVSRHARLVEVEPYQIGRHLHVRFTFETADAAGQNMTTAATWQICRWLRETLAGEDRLRPLRTLLEGNLSSDKKVSVASLLAGRGSRVTAECVLRRDVIARVLKSTPEAMAKGFAAATLGAAQAGMVGSGINAANVVAAMFVATGQDIACVHESGVSLLSLELDGDDLIATILLPSLVTGTVGGGTSLPRQREWLAALGCAGDGGGARFAEIVAGFALALDVSTAAALVSGQFADAHQRLGRSRRVNWLQLGDLDAALLRPLLAGHLGDPDLAVTGVTLAPPLVGDGVSSELGALGERRKLTGLHPVTVDWTSGAGEPGSADLVAKVKPRGEEIVAGIAMVASLCGPEVARAWSRWGAGTEFAASHRREPAVYRRPEPALRDLLPRTYGVVEDDTREAYVIVMERVTGDAGPWDRGRIDRALRAIARVHGHWLGHDFAADPWLDPGGGPEHLVKARELWEALARYTAAEQPELLCAGRLAVVLGLADTAGLWSQELAALPRTLVHHDFNPRNIAVAGERIIAYDWELASTGVPQRDVAELLAFTLGPDATAGDVAHHLDVHAAAVAATSPAAAALVAAHDWRRGYRLALGELLLSRLMLYAAAHTHREFDFLPRVLATAFHLWHLEAA
jgi:hydroxymethylglutaryl-CoA reductase (NADPH)